MLPEVKKILYATDLSESAKTALAWAMSLAEKYDAGISTIHIMPDLIKEMSAGMGYDLEAHFGADRLTEFNVKGKSAARDSVVKRIKAGHPVQEIVEAAVEGGYDLVIMGSHGHGFIDKILLGSVAQGVVQKCPIPVLTVRLTD